MERQEKKKKIESPENDEVQKTFLEKLKPFFCFCKTKKKKSTCSRVKKFNCCTKRSKNVTQNPVKSKTADKRNNLTDEPQKTFLEKVSAFFRSITCKKKKNHCFKKSSTTDDRESVTDEPQKTCLEKIRLLICCCKAKKRPEKQKQNKSLRIYIKQNCKWAILLLVIYIITFGAVVSGPILVNQFRVLNRNETEQERSMIRKIFKRII